MRFRDPSLGRIRMMRAITPVVLTSVSLFALPLAGQSPPCPGINFYSARQSVLFDPIRQNIIGLAQMMPGSFTAGQFPFFGPFQLQQFFLNFQKTILGCVPGPPGIDSRSIPAPIQSVPGAASQVVAAGKLADGRQVVVFVSPGCCSDGYAQVVVAPADFSPSLQPKSTMLDISGSGADSVLWADINGDGKGDVVILSRGTAPAFAGRIALYLGNGDGTF